MFIIFCRIIIDSLATDLTTIFFGRLLCVFVLSAETEKAKDAIEMRGSPIKPAGHLRQAIPSTMLSISEYEDVDPEILRKFREFIDNGRH